MNTKTQTDRINSIIKRLRQNRQKVGPESFVPYSYSAFFQSATVLALSGNLTISNNIINTLPPYSFFNGRQPSHQKQTISGYLRVYPNRHQESLLPVQSTDANKILLGMVEDDLLTDMRVQGGGVKNKFIAEQNGLNMWLGSYTDAGRYDGVPTGLGQIVVIEIPSALQAQKDRIFETAKKYLPSGIYPVIKFYTVP